MTWLQAFATKFGVFAIDPKRYHVQKGVKHGTPTKHGLHEEV